MNPAGNVRCNMETQIRLANHNCNFYRLKARVLLPSTPVMTHSVCVVANPGPLVRTSPRRVGALTQLWRDRNDNPELGLARPKTRARRLRAAAAVAACAFWRAVPIVAPDVAQNHPGCPPSIEKSLICLAPRAGFEPATNRLTAGCSTAELPGTTRASVRL